MLFRFARQAQPGEVGAHRFTAIGVSQGHGQPLDVRTEPAGAGIRCVGHAAMLAWYLSEPLTFMTQ